MTAIKGILALLLAGASALAAADTIYKYERDGRMVYSDSPVKGAKLVERIDLPAPPPAVQAPRAEPPGGMSELAETRAAELNAADEQIKEAARVLKEAEARQQQGCSSPARSSCCLVASTARFARSNRSAALPSSSRARPARRSWTSTATSTSTT